MNAHDLIEHLHWLGHDSFRLDGPPVIYFDPYKLSGSQPRADLVLVSHEHYDHCSPDDVKKVRGPKTVVLAGGAASQEPARRAGRQAGRAPVRGRRRSRDGAGLQRQQVPRAGRALPSPGGRSRRFCCHRGRGAPLLCRRHRPHPRDGRH